MKTPASIHTTIGFVMLTFAMTQISLAATYYIDFENGMDSRTGTSAAQSWKRCPGDTNATGTAASSVFTAGDTVIFKGGVHYRGEVVCKWSGTGGARIVYDGNTAGTFGAGRAVIDGSNPFTGWTACTSAADAGGNTNWSRLYKVTVPAGIDVFTANMYQGTNMLWPAQNPNVSDPFYADDLSTFTPIYCDQVTRTSLTDTNAFTQTNANYYAGCYLRLWGNPNMVYIISITNYIPAQHMVQFPDTGANSLYTDKTVYYAVVNNLLDVDQAGEYAIKGGTMYLWPAAGNPVTNEVGLSTRRRGIDINGKSNLDVQGFLIQKMTAGAGETTKGCGIVTRLGGSNIAIRDNEITRNYSQEKEGAIRMYGLGSSVCTNVLIENNSVYENPHNTGILVTLNDSIVRNNTLRKNGATGVDFYGCLRSQLTGNTVTDHRGVHANGLTLYLGCTDCLVAYNTVFDGLVALTLQDAFRITVAYNVLHTAQDGPTATDWSSSTHLADGIYYYNNVMLNSYGKALGIGGSAGLTNVIVRNNILDGCAFNPTNTTYSHNIYTALSWNQAARYGWSLGVGESIVSNKTLLFIDPTNRNFHTKSGSPAVDAGTNLGLTADHDRQPVPWGAAPDIGAYEYTSASSAGFTVSTNTGTAPLTVTFTDTSFGGSITNRIWSFGDGAVTNTTATSISHTYTVAGTNTVQLIVSGPLGASTNTQIAAVTVTLPPAPVAVFSASPTSGVAPLVVTFTDTSTGTITNRFWTFGDGGTTNTTATSIAHTYTAAGTKTVQLIVSGPGGASTNTQANLISVAAVPQVPLLLQETFTHPAGAPLIGTTPETGSMWATNGTGTGIKSNVVEGSLSAPAGFAASIGNRVVVGKDSAIIGKEMHSRFTAQTGAGAVTYMSFLMNMETLNVGKGGSCMALSENSGAEYAQFFITNTTPNTYATFGLGGRSTAPGIWSSGQFATGVTHLIVVSYEVVAGNNNDIMKMWINPTSFGGAAPAYDLQITGVAGGDAGVAGLNTVEIKNGSIMPRMGIDELRVGPTWASVTPSASAPAGDADGDGLPDEWETQYFGGATSADSSALAANGVNNIYETYIAGLNPTNPASVFLISDFRLLTSESILQWSAVSGRIYSVYWTTNLFSSFQALETNILWPQNSWTDAVHGAHGGNFYRIKVQLGQ